MKVLLNNKYLEEFDTKLLTKEVYNLFDDYNFINELVASNTIEENKNYLEIKKISKGNYSEELKKVTKIENYIIYLQEFNKKLEALKKSFTEEELIIFTYGVEERECDKELCDRICKSYKTYINIKKSCFVKIALRFNLSVEAVKATLDKICEIGV